MPELKKSKGPQLHKGTGPQLSQGRLTLPGIPPPPAGIGAGAGARSDPGPLSPPPPAAARNAEADSQTEMSELLQGFKARAAREDKRFIDATDSEFWVALCFQTRAQKEEFIAALGLLAQGDKYLDGLQV